MKLWDVPGLGKRITSRNLMEYLMALKIQEEELETLRLRDRAAAGMR